MTDVNGELNNLNSYTNHLNHGVKDVKFHVAVRKRLGYLRENIGGAT